MKYYPYGVGSTIQSGEIDAGAVTAAKLALEKQLHQQNQGNLYIPAWVYDVAVELQRFSFLQKRGQPSRGARVTFQKSENIWAIEAIDEGQLVPAWYPAWDPDDTSEADYATSSGVRYWHLSTIDYCEWTVPAHAAGCEKVVVVFFRVVGGGTGNVKVGGDIKDTFSTDGENGSLIETTITLDTPLADGDALRIDVASGVVRVHGVYCYDSDGVCVAGDQRLIVGSETAIHQATSGMELAYSMGPTGSAKKYFGAYAHQGGSYGTQVSVTPAYAVDGGAWNLATGYKRGYIVWSRSSTARYDATPTDLGTIEEAYFLTGDSIRFRAKFTATAAVDTGARYIAMLPLPQAGAEWWQANGIAYDVSDLENETPNYLYLPASTRIAVGGGTFNNTKVVMVLAFADPPVFECKVWGTANYKKIYWNLQSGHLTNLPVGTEWEGGWEYSIEYDAEAG